ncbi:MAG: Bifunctional protein GlmU [bacterium]|nr:Bifunctional protein GlmU [bacterium]
MAQPIVGAILAAGRGDRILPLSESWPKPLLPICNKPIIQYQLELMHQAGIREAYLVVGHLKERLRDWFGDGESLGMTLHYLEQESQLGIAHAVGKLEKHIAHPFLLFLGDIFIIPDRLERMVELFHQREAGAILAVMEDTPENIRRNFSVRLATRPDGSLDPSSRVVRVIEKPRYVNNPLKGCGIYLFDVTIFDAIRRTPRTALRDEYELTEAIQIFIDDGAAVYPANVIKADMNVTVPEDLLRISARELERRGLDAVVDPSTDVPEGCKLVRAVVGAQVSIPEEVTLIQDTVIFSHSRVRPQPHIRNNLITPEYDLYFEDYRPPAAL